MFKKLIKMAGITKLEFAKVLGLNYRTVYAWKDNPPQYATAYLKLLIELNRYKP